MPDQPTITMNEIIHAAVRRDLARAEAALRAFPDGDRQRAADLKRAWDFLSEMLHEHHVGEDENVWPYLRTLGEIDPELADVMESEHVEMAAAMARASAAMNQLAAEATSDAAETAAMQVAAAAAVTDGHLVHEEEAVMPLVVARRHQFGGVEQDGRERVGCVLRGRPMPGQRRRIDHAALVGPRHGPAEFGNGVRRDVFAMRKRPQYAGEQQARLVQRGQIYRLATREWQVDRREPAPGVLRRRQPVVLTFGLRPADRVDEVQAGATANQLVGATVIAGIEVKCVHEFILPAIGV